MKVVLTATVVPQSDFRLHLVDPAERREQYRKSFAQWVDITSKSKCELIIVENSGEDLERLLMSSLVAMPRHVRLLSAPTPATDVSSRGKGASEAAMLDFALERIEPTSGDELWLKCTGRLSVSNFRRCVPSIFGPTRILARLALNLEHMDTRFYGASHSIWMNNFRGIGDEVDERNDQRIEIVAVRRVAQAIAEGASLARFRVQPAFDGRSGTWKTRNYSGMRSTAKRVIANGIETALRGPLAGKHY